MGIPAESRSILGHLFNISMPYSYENPVWALVCGGVESLDEEFNPEDDEIQYICEKTKTVNVSGYGISFDIDVKYIKGSQMQFWIDHQIRTLPTGSGCAFDYIRFNKAEQMFDSTAQFIGVRRRGTVYPNSIGGDAGDPLNCNLTVAGSGNGEYGYVEVTAADPSINKPASYTWVAKSVDIPFISEIGNVKMSGYYPGVLITPSASSSSNDSVAKIKISGKGVGGQNVGIIKSNSKVYGSLANVNSTSSEWTIEIPESEFRCAKGSNNGEEARDLQDSNGMYSISIFHGKETPTQSGNTTTNVEKNSVTGQVIKFKLPDITGQRSLPNYAGENVYPKTSQQQTQTPSNNDNTENQNETPGGAQGGEQTSP